MESSILHRSDDQRSWLCFRQALHNLELNAMEPPGLEQLHVLVVIEKNEEQQLPAEAGHDRLAKYRHEKQKLAQNAVHDRHKDPSTSTNVGLGHSEIARLEKGRMISDAELAGDGQAFWSEASQLQANAFTSEAEFGTFITPFLCNMLRSCGMVLINGEMYPWLPQSTLVTCALKPFGFGTHYGIVRIKPEMNDGVQLPAGFRFGEAVEEWLDSLVVFESTLTITPAAFGQVVRYFQQLGPDGSASVVLFDRFSFWLIGSHKAVILKSFKSKVGQ